MDRENHPVGPADRTLPWGSGERYDTAVGTTGEPAESAGVVQRTDISRGGAGPISAATGVPWQR